MDINFNLIFLDVKIPKMSDNIVVAIRLRALIPREISESANINWISEDEKSLVNIDPESKKPLSKPFFFGK